jgi:hypothetical protein
VRQAYAALRRPGADVRYVTIDDVRWCLAGPRPWSRCATLWLWLWLWLWSPVVPAQAAVDASQARDLTAAGVPSAFRGGRREDREGPCAA